MMKAIILGIIVIISVFCFFISWNSKHNQILQNQIRSNKYMIVIIKRQNAIYERLDSIQNQIKK